MDINCDVITYFSENLYFKKAEVAIVADIIKTLTKFIKTIFKDSRKLEKLEIMYLNGIYICISSHSKIC